MKQRIALFVAALSFLVAFEVSAQVSFPEWTEREKSWVFENFNAAWQRAFDGLVPLGVVKPEVRTFNETPEQNCRGLAIGVGYDGVLVFCNSFLVRADGTPRPEAEKIFLLDHEIAHVVLSHDAELAAVKGKPEYLAARIKVECEANVFVAKIESVDFALSVIKNWKLNEQSSTYVIYGPAYERSKEVLEGKRKDCN